MIICVGLNNRELI